ncbi:MAG: site-specific integrase [archaeon]
MKIHQEGHIPIWDVTFERIQARLDANKDGFLPDNLELIKRFVMDAKLGKTIKGRAKKKVGEKRILKYLQDLKKLDQYLNKPFNQSTEQDIERFILDLEEGRVKTVIGNPYKQETQVVIKKLVKKFYRWLGKPELTDWIDTSIEPTEYRAISKEQVDNIVNLCTSTKSQLLLRNRAIMMFLFDAGVRADELLNIRISHLSRENDIYKVRIEFSKTKKRTISLPFCTKYLNEWLDAHSLRNEPLAQLFPLNYNMLRELVKRMGCVIKVRLTPHSLRHSSATYWCQHLTPYELCYRMGWGMSSRMPQRYIDREGLQQEKAAKIVKAARMEQLEADNTTLSRRLAILEDQLNRLDIEEATKIINMVKTRREFF